MDRILPILCLALFVACDEETPTPHNVSHQVHAAVEFTLGVGEQSFNLDRCIIRKGISPRRMQLEAWSESGKPRLLLEFPFGEEGPLLNVSLAPSMFVMSLDVALAEDEDPTYENEDVRIVVSHIDDHKVKGRIKGRVVDLLLSRPHEIRARFTCGLDR
jgi:hypothetical protein